MRTCLMFTALLAACGSSSSSTTSTSGGSTTGGGSTSGGTTGGGATTGGGLVAPFLGGYSCVYSGTYTLTGSSAVHNNPAYTSNARVNAGTTSDLVISGLLSEGIAGTCVGTLNVTGQDTAAFAPAMQSCPFTESNGNQQTNVGTGNLTVTASSGTLVVDGTFTGTTATSVPYSGVYQGTWICARH